jgi:phenylacetate-CoA ligase
VTWRLRAYTWLQALGGSSVGRRYEEFLRLEALAPNDYTSECERRLSSLLEHAARTVPFYRERVQVHRPTLGDFPILRRRDLAEHFAEFMTPAFRDARARPTWLRYGAATVQTGGTTGTPTTVIHDASFRDQGRASRLYSQYLCGFPFGTPYTQVWGSMRDINQSRDSVAKRVLTTLSGHFILNAFRLNDARVDDYLALLEARGIRHLMAYVDAALALATRALERGQLGLRLDSVMACAGTLTESSREVIAEAFGARVHNKYGSRECTDMTCECEYGSMHVYSHHVHLEVVDDDGRPLDDTQSGRILATLIGNRSFPIIRYEIGDIGSTLRGPCACSRPLPRFGAIEGRTMQRVAAADGSYISPIYFRHLIGVVHNPGRLWRRFQFTQLTESAYDLALEPSAGVSFEDTQRAIDLIRRDLLAVLGSESRLQIRVVPEIASEQNGKFLDVRNHSATGDAVVASP